MLKHAGQSPNSGSPRTYHLRKSGLVLVEDEHGNEQARCHPLRPERTPRAYEITGPADWAALARDYPLTVDYSRRHDWWRASGSPGPWRIPDWAGIASDYDAVHLSIPGYLSTAGRALPAGEAYTLLGGWDPDQTYWLTDILVPSGRPTDWHQEGDEPSDWTQTTPGEQPRAEPQ
jgi:hypothetical protein